MLRRRILRIKAIQALYAYGKQRQACLRDQPNKALSVGAQRTLQVEGLRAIKQDLQALMDGYAHSVSVLSALWHKHVISGEDAHEKALYQQFVRLCSPSATHHEGLEAAASRLWTQLEGAKSMKDRIRFMTCWLKDEAVSDAREQHDIKWQEHRRWIKETLVRQLKQLGKSESRPVMDAQTIKKRLLGEGQAFVSAIFTHSLAQYAVVEEVLEKALKNWTIERLSGLDKAILHAAASEWRLYPQTPKQVIFDESIEIAKEYGTPNSPAFVNGVLQTLYDAYIVPLADQQASRQTSGAD